MAVYEAIDLQAAALRHVRYYEGKLMRLRELYDTDPQGAVQQLRKALAQIQQAYQWLLAGADDAEIARALVGFIYLSLDRVSLIVSPAEWETWLDVGIQHAAQLQMLNEQVDLMIDRSRIEFRRGEMEAALGLMEVCLPVAQQAENLTAVGRCYMQMGLIQQKQGEVQAAQAAMEQARQAYELVDDKKGLSLLNSFRAQVAIDAGKYDRARAILVENIDLLQQMGDERGRAIEQYQLGVILANRRQYDDALEHLEPARRTFNRLSVRRYEAYCLQLIGASYVEMEQPGVALGHLQRAYDLFHHVQDGRGVAIMLTALGDAQKALGHMEQAIDYYRQAVEQATAIDYAFHMAEGNRGIGKVYMEQGDWQNARLYLQRAFEVASESNILLLALQALVSFVPVLIHDGELQRAHDYITFIRASTDEALILDQIPDMPDGDYAKARLLDLVMIQQELQAPSV